MKTKRKTSAKFKNDRPQQAAVPLPPQPTPPVSIEPIKRMAEDLQAIWLLCETRSKYGFDAAQMMLRRISFNEIQFVLMKLEQEWQAKPILERHFLPNV